MIYTTNAIEALDRVGARTAARARRRGRAARARRARREVRMRWCGGRARETALCARWSVGAWRRWRRCECVAGWKASVGVDLQPRARRIGTSTNDRARFGDERGSFRDGDRAIGRPHDATDLKAIEQKHHRVVRLSDEPPTSRRPLYQRHRGGLRPRRSRQLLRRCPAPSSDHATGGSPRRSGVSPTHRQRLGGVVGPVQHFFRLAGQAGATADGDAPGPASAIAAITTSIPRCAGARRPPAVTVG